MDIFFIFINNRFSCNEDLIYAKCPKLKILKRFSMDNENIFLNLPYIELWVFLTKYKSAYPTSKDLYIY